MTQSELNQFNLAEARDIFVERMKMNFLKFLMNNIWAYILLMLNLLFTCNRTTSKIEIIDEVIFGISILVLNTFSNY